MRRKLCTNCGAPKPSAVRNAVGVRPVTDPDPKDRDRLRPDISFGPSPPSVSSSAAAAAAAVAASHPLSNTSAEAYPRRPIPVSSTTRAYPYLQAGSSLDGTEHTPLNSVLTPTSLGLAPSQPSGLPTHPPFAPNDHRAFKTQHASDPMRQQAHSLAMRCPGDDIPLPPSSRPAVAAASLSLHDSTQRLRMGHALLGDPLVNPVSLPSQHVFKPPDQLGHRHGTHPLQSTQTHHHQHPSQHAHQQQHQHHGNMMNASLDFSGNKVFHTHESERGDAGMFSLPSMHGVNPVLHRGQGNGHGTSMQHAMQQHGMQSHALGQQMHAHHMRTGGSTNMASYADNPALNSAIQLTQLSRSSGLNVSKADAAALAVAVGESTENRGSMGGMHSQTLTMPTVSRVHSMHGVRGDKVDGGMGNGGGVGTVSYEGESGLDGQDAAAASLAAFGQGASTSFFHGGSSTGFGTGDREHAGFRTENGTRVGTFGVAAAGERFEKTARVGTETQGEGLGMGAMGGLEASSATAATQLDEGSRPSDDGRFTIENILTERKHSTAE